MRIPLRTYAGAISDALYSKKYWGRNISEHYAIGIIDINGSNTRSKERVIGKTSPDLFEPKNSWVTPSQQQYVVLYQSCQRVVAVPDTISMGQFIIQRHTCTMVLQKDCALSVGRRNPKPSRAQRRVGVHDGKLTIAENRYPSTVDLTLWRKKFLRPPYSCCK